jgi:hypothetical protein
VAEIAVEAAGLLLTGGGGGSGTKAGSGTATAAKPAAAAPDACWMRSNHRSRLQDWLVCAAGRVDCSEKVGRGGRKKSEVHQQEQSSTQQQRRHIAVSESPLLGAAGQAMLGAAAAVVGQCHNTRHCWVQQAKQH